MRLKEIVIVNIEGVFKVGITVGRIIQESITEKSERLQIKLFENEVSTSFPVELLEEQVNELQSWETPTWLSSSESYKQAKKFLSGLDKKEESTDEIHN